MPSQLPLDLETAKAWAPVVSRGYLIDTRQLMIAKLEKPGDHMWKQILDALKAGGRVYPTINASGTVTGRMTVTGPNLQGLSASYRRVLLAEPGMALVGLDLDHIEPSVAALLSGDSGLTVAVVPGADPYLACAAEIFGEPVTDKADRRRAVAKKALLALLYGQGAHSLASDLAGGTEPTGEQITEAQRAQQAILAGYPGLASWSANLRRVAASRGQLTTIGGRDVSDVGVDDRGNRAAYRAVNYVTQGSAADIFKRLVLRTRDLLEAAGFQNPLYLPIHDELVIQIPIERAEEARQVLQAGMTGRVTYESRAIEVTGEAEILGTRFTKL